MRGGRHPSVWGAQPTRLIDLHLRAGLGPHLGGQHLFLDRKEWRPTCIAAVSTQLTNCCGMGELPNRCGSIQLIQPVVGIAGTHLLGGVVPSVCCGLGELMACCSLGHLLMVHTWRCPANLSRNQLGPSGLTVLVMVITWVGPNLGWVGTPFTRFGMGWRVIGWIGDVYRMVGVAAHAGVNASPGRYS